MQLSDLRTRIRVVHFDIFNDIFRRETRQILVEYDYQVVEHQLKTCQRLLNRFMNDTGLTGLERLFV